MARAGEGEAVVSQPHASQPKSPGGEVAAGAAAALAAAVAAAVVEEEGKGAGVARRVARRQRAKRRAGSSFCGWWFVERVCVCEWVGG